MDPVVTLLVMFASIAIIGTALAGIHDAIARIIQRERRYQDARAARIVLGRHVPYRNPR